MQPLRIVIAASVALLGLALPVAAEEPAESFLKSWVASTDAAPEWRATYSRLTSDPAGGRTTLYGLAVTSEAPGFSLAFDSIAVSGFVPSADGAFTAGQVRLDGGEIVAGEFITLKIADAEFSDFALPPMAAFAWNDPRPLVAMVKALAPLSGVKMSAGRIGSLVLLQTVDGVTSRASYSQVAIEHWADGRIASIKAGPLTTESPAEEPLTAISVAGVESRDIDFGAMLALFDPDRYVGGRGDRVWHTVVGGSTYRDMIMAIPGASVRIGEASLEDFRVRQPAGGIGALLEIGMPGTERRYDDPEESVKLLDLLSAYGIGKFTMSDLQVRATGIDRMSMGSLTLTDFSSDKLGEFAIDRIDGAIAGQGSVSVGRFAFGDLVLPPLADLIAAARAEEAGQDADLSALAVKLGFIEAAAVDVAPATMPRVGLERLRVDLDNYIGPVPTSVALDLVDADVAVALIEDERTRIGLQDLGYERVRVDAALKMDWSADGEIRVDRFHLAMADFGALSGNVTLTGISPSEIDRLDEAAVMEKLSFVRGSLTVTDDSIVGRGLAAQATRLKADPAKFREQFATGLPFMLTFLGDMELQKQLAPVLQAFIRTTGGSITAVAGPDRPVPLPLIAVAGETAPFTLLKLLAVTFSGVAGEALPAPAPADAPQTVAPVAPTPAAPADGPAKGDALRKSIEPKAAEE